MLQNSREIADKSATRIDMTQAAREVVCYEVGVASTEANMRPLVGCAVVIFLAACSGATPGGFGSAGGDDSSGDDSSNNNNGGDGGTGTTGDGGGSTVVPPAPTQLLAGADVSEVNVYQGSESVIVKGGAASTPGVT